MPSHCSAQQAPTPRQDVVRVPIVEGRDIRFRSLSNAQNLSNVRVESIVQDTQGFIWFGTSNGLNRYDGYKFKLFKHEPGNPKSLSGVCVYSLFKDHLGNLRIRTEGFLDRFDPGTESFTHYELGKPATNRLSRIVSDISEDSNGILWLSSFDGLLRLDPNSGELKHYIHDPADSSTLADNAIRSTGEDRHGDLWVATSRTLTNSIERQAK